MNLEQMEDLDTLRLKKGRRLTPYEIGDMMNTIRALYRVAWTAKRLSIRLHSDGGILPGEIDNLDEALVALQPWQVPPS